MPISECGLRLSHDAVRIAVGMHLGTELAKYTSAPAVPVLTLVETMLFLAGTILMKGHSITTI